MKHEYFKGVDFDNLPKYEEALTELTDFEKVFGKVCEELSLKYVNLHKENQEKRENIYFNEIFPFCQKHIEEFPEELR